jgi:hypothetical protein
LEDNLKQRKKIKQEEKRDRAEEQKEKVTGLKSRRKK